MERENILEVKDLSVSFYTEEGVVPAVDDLSMRSRPMLLSHQLSINTYSYPMAARCV